MILLLDNFPPTLTICIIAQCKNCKKDITVIHSLALYVYLSYLQATWCKLYVHGQRTTCGSEMKVDSY